MSTIEMMGILGIRSFGPETGDMQRVRFFRPLTLILGPNGTGKTTIIECLKYAATGDLPPGSKGSSSGNFVHDPKLAREREIKAQVKLMIRDVTGNACTVERSMVARVKDGKGKSKPTMQTLDGVLTRRNVVGEKQSITSRCADLNREMIGAMGVSKAVLENVIFCHQEDSNWPLSEGKALKDKFDAIFASTRYTKVLDEIKKLKQHQEGDIREGKKELEYLKQHKVKAEELKGDLEQLQAKLAASVDSVEKINVDLEPIKTKLSDLNDRYNEIYKLQSSRDKFLSEKEHVKKAIQLLKENIKEPFEGTTSELEEELRDFSLQVQKKKDEQNRYKREQDELAAEISRIEKEKSKLFVEIGKLQNEAGNNDENLKKRDQKIIEISELYNFEEFTSDSQIDDDLYRIFFDRIKKKLTEMMADARQRKAEFEEKEEKLQTKIDELKTSKAKMEHTEKMKKETIAKNRDEIKELSQNLNKMASSAGRLTSIAADLKRSEKEVSNLEQSLNVDDIQKEIQDLDGKKKKLDASISELNSEMVKLHKQSEVQTKLDMLLGNQKDKEESIERLKTEHEESIQSLLGPVPLDDLRESLCSYISTQGDSVKRANAELTKLRTSLSTKQAEKTSVAAQLRKKEDELRELEGKISSVCDSQDLDSEFTEVQRSLTQAQEEKGCLLGAEHMIKKYIRGLERNNPACPLCSRGFAQAQEVRELVLKLQEQLRKVPSNMRKAEQDMETYQKKYDDMMQLRPVTEAVQNIRDKEIPELKNRLKRLEEDVRTVKRDLEVKEEECMIQEGDLQTAKGLQPDVVDMDRRRGEVRQLQRSIEDLRSTLEGGAGHTGRAMNDVVVEKEEKQLDLESVTKSIDLRRKRLADHQTQVHKLKSQVQGLQGEKLAIEGQLQQRSKLEERKATLVSENTNMQRDIEEAREQLAPVDAGIVRYTDEKSDIVRQKEAMAEQARAEVDEVKNKGTSVKNLNTEIRAYTQSGKPERLECCQARQCELAAQQTDTKGQQEDVAVKLAELADSISGQQVRQRELQDTLELHRKQEEVLNLDKKVAALKAKLGDLDLKNLEQDRQRLLKTESDLTQQLHNATGRQQGFKDQIKSTEKELASTMYKDANKKYSTKVIENKTTEIANGDLQKYYAAMDKAIMMYHKSKMEEINIIIRELWKNTYMGNDIETIEIQSEAEDATTGTAIKNRRNYNYRVVMIKNGIPIDMRGRCSAGQKVLASLIIRLALAETFCVNCGVLALDEPTTNLDRANIESLATALTRIINERSTHRRFQLVVITHDEEFVERLGRSEHVDQYIEVSKNHEGLSRLTQKNVEMLHS